MKKIIIFFLIVIVLPVFAYEVYNCENYRFKDNGDKLLFVVDFSNSMSERLNHETKAVLVKNLLTKILPQISSDTRVGMRVYGHTNNVFAYNACRSSELISPITENNSANIINAMSKLRPRGMTPITYSLKQAVRKDFAGMNGQKHIILLTDGGENCDESPCDYSISLVKTRRDINIDVIAFNVDDADDLAQLKCTADMTGGKFVEADTNAELIDSMQRLITPHKEVEAVIMKQE